MSFNKNRLIALRKQNNLTLNAVEWGTIIHRSRLKRIEEGKTPNPTFTTVAKLADFFKVNVETFRKVRRYDV